MEAAIGLWYPIVVEAMSFVVGPTFLSETKDPDITQRLRITIRFDFAVRAFGAGPFCDEAMKRNWQEGACRKTATLVALVSTPG